MNLIGAIDIGSTFTKGLVLQQGQSGLQLMERSSSFTTRNALAEGFFSVLGDLEQKCGVKAGTLPVRCSSSAKGGLSIAAIGIVPDLTLKMARLTACSAGGKIVSCYSYKLTEEDQQSLEALNPDIILFSGGTDGGNEDYPLYNAAVLNETNITSTILYSGNRVVSSQVKKILKDKPLVITENILPEMQSSNPEPARAEIQRIFLDLIGGKGLLDVLDRVTGPIAATPYRIFEFLKLLSQGDSRWDNCGIIDLGGATTDIYSLCPNWIESEEVLFKGIPEPRAKRTVEGDLGMRVSARDSWESSGAVWYDHLAQTFDRKDFEHYLDKVTHSPSYLPDSKLEQGYDRFISKLCAGEALQRHCGTRQKMYISTGAVMVQRGKNLKQLKTIIGSGGYLSRVRDFNPLEPSKPVNEEGLSVLLPEKFEYIADRDYLLPLAANISAADPQRAVSWFSDELLSAKGEIKNGN